MNSRDVTFNPWLRAVLAGMAFEISLNGNRYDIRLVDGEQLVARKSAPRATSLTLIQAIDKARNGRWGPSSAFYQALEALADVAEAYAATQNRVRV